MKISNFKFQISKTTLVFFVVIGIFSMCWARTVFADASTDNGLAFLKGKQDSSGRITGGYSAPSQWSAIAFTINGVDVSTVKNSSISLKDFLLTDNPSNPAATDLETRILSIVAIGDNPANFNGVDYVTKLQGFATSGQIGDTCALNDDIFGLMALTASGSLADSRIKQDTLDFIISKQDADGGFSWSAPGCSWYATSPDMSGAAAEALQAAKDNSMSSVGLDAAITNVKNYLLTHQNSDGGYGAWGSDADTTGWALIGLNALGLKDSTEAGKAKTYLLSTQQSDGGFMSFSGTDSTTTANGLIALSGKGWVFRIYAPNVTSPITPTILPTATPTSMPSVTPTPTPKTEMISVLQQIAVTVTPNPSNTKTGVKKTKPQPTTTQVLGASTKDQPADSQPQPTEKPQMKTVLVQAFGTKSMFLFGAASLCLLLAIVWGILRYKHKLSF